VCLSGRDEFAAAAGSAYGVLRTHFGRAPGN
jgi:hypothetical protein